MEYAKDTTKPLLFEKQALKFLLENNDDIGGEGFDSISLNKVLTGEEFFKLFKKSNDHEYGILSLLDISNKKEQVELYDCNWNFEKTGDIPVLGFPNIIIATKNGCKFMSVQPGSPFW